MTLLTQPSTSVRTLGGKEIPVVVGPRIRKTGIVRKVIGGLSSLLTGMKITLKYLVRPSTVVTEQYPENRATLKMHERFRGVLETTTDENGYHSCTACGGCQTACPNLSIQVLSRRNASGKGKEIDHLLWRMDSCSFCNACVQACPSGALRFTDNFESAVYDRRLLVWNLIPYAGPPAKDMLKIEDVEQRQTLMEPRPRYSGPIPMKGQAMAGTPPLAEPVIAGTPPLAEPAPSEDVPDAECSSLEGNAPEAEEGRGCIF